VLTARQRKQAGPGFEATIARRFKASLLQGEVGLPAGELAEAARFVAALALSRKPGEAAIAVESATGRVGRRMTRLAVVNDNMPFLLDSIAAAIAETGLSVDRLFHPLVNARRSADGDLLDLPARAEAGTIRESVIYIETPRVDARARAGLRAMLASVLADVRAAVGDWTRLRAAMAVDADRLEREGESEGAALLRWFESGMLTQLGHVLRWRDGRQTGALGVCRRSAKGLLQGASYDRAFAWFDAGKGPAPLMVKANMASNVHRRVPLDLFIVPLREQGKVVALSVHAGVWTSAALAASPREVPRLRAQLAQAARALGVHAEDHDGKALVHAFTALPHDMLIGFDTADLARVATRMMSLVDRPRPSLVLVRSALERHLFAFVWLPRDAVSTALRQDIQAMLEEAAQAPTLDWSLEVEGALALLRFTLDIREGDIQGGAGPVDEAALGEALSAKVRGWDEAIEAALAEGEEPARAAAWAARYADAFPLSYRSLYGPAEAARDIVRLRGLDGGAGVRRDARIHCRYVTASDRLQLKIYQQKGSLALSDAVPMLENFGFRVSAELPTLLHAGEMGAIHDFDLTTSAAVGCDAIVARAAEVEGALAAVLNGEAEDDAFNRLVVSTGLALGEANWLRAWFRYMRQAGATWGAPTAVEALEKAPDVTHALIALLRAHHDPAFTGDRASASDAARQAISDGLAGVAAINDDRLLRQYRAVIEAILRTNAFAPPAPPEREVALAFKFDSALVPGLPAPRPWREIFVYSRRVEGIHLRAGPIARGGLRWSDRRDDYRTEVLGLMKAQRVKNAVIVPTGAKGGFYPKQLPDPARDREGWAAEGREAYRVFVRSLLSLTDNLVDGAVVHPAGMVVRDGDDPYFVVAADKGTATFSDTANALAAEVDFWLDDAFASGGSKGYDHKAMGITARGAWLSVQRHFLELGVDVQADPVRVAGCGDMSGDVFGNGMLLSQAIKLVAAFDHRHIFLDPDPDPAASWAERQRLFALPRSSWDDYDRKLISPGGGVFARSAKEIRLSPQVRAVLGMTAEAVDPEALIAAILQSPVDLLWFGGIGTYVKASHESNAEVGDHANAAVRVDGARVRARVIGEGANLGCTQAGRIEYALAGALGADAGIRGGRINTDFIDNSAGVDCSDNEVNIKIALASARRAGRLDEKRRVALLARMTGSVAAQVLEDNRLQALALSIAEAGGAAAIPSLARVIEVLEERGQIDRRTDGLADGDTLARRAGEGRGLVRPELAVLMSSAKLEVKAALDLSDVPDDPGLEEDLVAAFPREMRGAHAADIDGHRLRREIIATRLGNRMINRLGLVHPFELVEQEGATLAQVSAAFVAAERLFGLGKAWQAAETAAMPEAARVLLFEQAAAALRPHMADLLRAGAGATPPSRLVEQLSGPVDDLRKAARRLIGAEARRQSGRLHDLLTAAGAPAAQAMFVAELHDLDGAIGVAVLARETGIGAVELARAFVDIGARLGLDWAQGSAALASPSDPWERLLVGGLARDFQHMRLDFLRRVLTSPDREPMDAVESWAAVHAPAIRQFRAMVARAEAAVMLTPAMLAQLASQARSLLAR